MHKHAARLRLRLPREQMAGDRPIIQCTQALLQHAQAADETMGGFAMVQC